MTPLATLASSLAAALYLSCAGQLAFYLQARRHNPYLHWIFVGVAIALVSQAVALIDRWVSFGQVEFSFFSAASGIAWMITAIAAIWAISRQLTNLLIAWLPFAAIASLLAGHFEPVGHAHQALPAGLIVHILLSVLAYSILSLAALQSAAVLFQDRQLKQHRSLRGLPPLQTMERLLFDMVACGWALLTMSIVTGAFYLDDMFAQHVAHKTLLSLLAWLVFSVLLWGRHQLGWRGPRAVRWTLSGFALLAFAFFGSKLVLELILGKS